MMWIVRILSILLAVGFVFGLDGFAHGVLNDYGYRLLVLAGLYVTLSVSLNLINGITGQFSIGHAAFYQVGAYAAGFCSVKFFASQHLDKSFWLIGMMGVGALASAVAGFVVGLPSLRLRGDYLAVVTLGFGEIIRILTNNMEAIGGSYGMSIQPKVNVLPYAWMLAILAIATCRNLLKTAHGLPFLAVREDEVASSAMGVDVTRVKVTAFLIGSAFAGAAGALLAHFEGFINPDMFKMDVSFLILTMVVLGGTGSITGSTLAAMLLFAIPESPRFMIDKAGNPLLVTGAMLMSGIIFLVAAVYTIKRLVTHFHGPKSRRGLLIFGTILGGIIGTVMLSAILGNVPALAHKTWPAGSLRMVLLAMSLIVLMLLRPQGIFAHHEFSWSFVARLFGRGPRAKEQGA